ncbi:hypothetical protein MMP66_07990 [Acinetobacter dispersus]|uniref:hypothetical protein n=1 Tax=Acinetobacter dispersus TaxID=70348 RepID=UPI001F4A13D2|nr:hypothetical protein [Acinetobacter dispersus]MCH7394220.1 hypothetical protein [Acinetobacter dispersus]
MSNILNAQDAFTALQNGKNLLCRMIGGEFDELNQFPATVWAMDSYEFCIDIEKIELAGITFTQPLKLEEYQEGQDVFVINTYAPSIYVMNFNTSALVESINSGFVQRDAENAKLQLKAVSKALGREFNGEVTITRLGKETSKSKRKKDSQAAITTVDDKSLQIEHNKDLVIDAIATCLTAEEVETTCYGLEKNGFNDAQQEQITAAKLLKIEQLEQVKAAAENENHELFNQDTSEPELSVLCEAFIEDIEKCLSLDDLNSIRHRINANGVLTDDEHAELAKHINLKTSSFDTPQTHTTTETSSVPKDVNEDEAKYQEKLNTLKQRVDESKTPAEVNAVVKYTNGWTTEQLSPLLKHMHKRLEVLQNEKAAIQPSLMVQIQNAPDLTTLDALEIDVSSIDPIAQPEMMRYVRARRAELEQAAPSTSIDEDLP